MCRALSDVLAPPLVCNPIFHMPYRAYFNSPPGCVEGVFTMYVLLGTGSCSQYGLLSPTLGTRLESSGVRYSAGRGVSTPKLIG